VDLDPAGTGKYGKVQRPGTASPPALVRHDGTSRGSNRHGWRDILRLVPALNLPKAARLAAEFKPDAHGEPA